MGVGVQRVVEVEGVEGEVEVIRLEKGAAQTGVYHIDTNSFQEGIFAAQSEVKMVAGWEDW
jgi:hypothetical protein